MSDLDLIDLEVIAGTLERGSMPFHADVVRRAGARIAELMAVLETVQEALVDAGLHTSAQTLRAHISRFRAASKAYGGAT